jgi:hypothetical protein
LAEGLSEMTQAGTVAAGKLLGRLQAPAGLQQKIGQIAEVAAFELPLVEFDHIQTRNIAADVLEKSTAFKYPVVLVYAERIKNKQTEKFRRFSGQVDLVVEMRLTQDRVDDLEAKIGAYVDAVTDVLESTRGDWGDCVYYSGQYEVVFDAVKRGGTGFAQRARVMLPVHVSVS